VGRSSSSHKVLTSYLNHPWAGLLFIFIFTAIILSGCGSSGGGGGNSESSASNTSNNSRKLSSAGQAILGPLVDSIVELYPLSGLDQPPILTATTAFSTDLDEAGTFSIPGELVNDNELYLVKIIGGEDIDVDDDGVLDALPTPNSGTIHAVLTADQLRTGNYHISVVTEVVYQLLRYTLSADYPRETIEFELDRQALMVLKSDIDGDSDIDRDDIVFWHPRRDRNALRHNPELYTAITDQILSGGDPNAEALTVGDMKIGAVDTPGIAQGVAMANGYAYIADHFDGLQIIDVRDHYRPHIVASFPMQDRTSNVYVKDDIAYLSSGPELHIIDIRNPFSPLTVSRINTPGWPHRVIVENGLAYIAEHTSGLQVIDVSDALNPVIVGSVDTPSYALGVALSGGFAYIADGNSGLQVVDINDPSRPVLVGSIDTPGFARNVAIHSTYAYISDEFEGGLVVADVADPSHPFIISSIPGIFAYDITIVDKTAYVACERAGVLVVDISDPAKPEVLDRIDSEDANGLVVSGGFAYVADGEAGLTIIDVHQTVAPSYIATVPTTANPSSIAVNDGLALITGPPSQLEVVDVQDPANPAMLSSVPIPCCAERTVFQNGIAYVASFGEGVQIIDLSNPGTPYIASSIDTPGSAVDIDVIGSTAYVSDFYSGLQIIDISNTGSPVIVANVPPSLTVSHNAAIANGFAYVAESTVQGLSRNTISVVDVSDLNNPTTVGGGFELPNFSLAITGNFAYAFDDSRRLKAIDLSNPVNLVVGSYIETLDYSLAELAAEDGFLYVADGYAGLKIYDLTNPALPVRVGTVKTLDRASHVAVSKGYIYITDGIFGLRTVRAMQKELP
jgi:hypothetical protein